MQDGKHVILYVDDDPDFLRSPSASSSRRTATSWSRPDRGGGPARLQGVQSRPDHRRPDDGGGRCRHELRQGTAGPGQHGTHLHAQLRRRPLQPEHGLRRAGPGGRVPEADRSRDAARGGAVALAAADRWAGPRRRQAARCDGGIPIGTRPIPSILSMADHR